MTTPLLRYIAALNHAGLSLDFHPVLEHRDEDRHYVTVYDYLNHKHARHGHNGALPDLQAAFVRCCRDMGLGTAGRLPDGMTLPPEAEPVVAYWHHPESCCVFTASAGEDPGDPLCVEITAGEFIKLRQQYAEPPKKAAPAFSYWRNLETGNVFTMPPKATPASLSVEITEEEFIQEKT